MDERPQSPTHPEDPYGTGAMVQNMLFYADYAHY